MIKLLYKPTLGKLIHLDSEVYRVVAIGEEYGCLPGGKNVFACEVVYVCGGTLPGSSGRIYQAS